MRRGALIDERFEIEALAGAGAMGSIYRAFDRTHRAPVALKIVRGVEFGARFIREARVIASLSHPAVVRYVAHGALPSGDLYMAMEWLEGEDLARRLRDGRVSPGEAVALGARVAEGLAAAHAMGIVHRDVKPANIFLPRGDVAHAKVIDFGIARVSSATQAATQTGVIIGTPGYMAPEQAKGVSGIDARADIFALGCVLYHCLSGRAPFAGEDMLSVLAKLILEEPAPVSALSDDIPRALSDLVMTMMAKEPHDRLPNGEAVARALAALDLSPQGGGARRSPAADERITGVISVRQSPAPASQQGDALTLSEQRIVSVVLAGAGGGEEERSLVAPEIERAGGRFNALADGSMVVTIWGSGSAVDRAERAARCALAVQGCFPDVAVTVVTGRGIVSTRVVEGDVIDRGVRAVRATRPGAIRIDSATAGMLGSRFITEPFGDDLILRGEGHLRETPLLFLGKPTPCVGRSGELSILEVTFATLEEPRALPVLVIGPAGAGKSRLRRAFVDKLRRRPEPVEILMGRADWAFESSPFGPIADALREAAGIWGNESIESRRHKLLQRLRRHLEGERLARAAAFLGELTRVPFPEEQHRGLRAARQSAQIMGDAMRAAWEDWLTAECQAQPVVLILEDLQWADAATVQMIDATLRNLRDLPFMVLALARPEIRARFPGLWAPRDVQIVKLGPLSRRASAELVRGALGAGAHADVVARIVERADGNPFYLEELVRAVVAGRGETFPDSVLGIVEARLDAQGAEAKRVLRAASVFGARFTRRGVTALLGPDQDLEEAGALLSALASRELIAPDGDHDGEGDASYVFRHALVREAAYATLTEADRALGHRLAGAWIEQSDHRDAMTLAEHFRRGEEPARAAHWYRRAAEEALKADDLTAVLDRVERGVACGAEGEDLGVLRLVEAEAHLWRGDVALAEQRGVEATELFAAGSPAWFRAVHQVVVAGGKRGGLDRVERWAIAAAAIPGADACSDRIVCLSRCAQYLSFGGLHAAADVLMDALERMVAVDAEAIALVHEARAGRAIVEGDLGGCLENLQAALAAFEQAEDRRNACVERANLGFAYAELGDFEGSERALRAALLTADRMGLHDTSMFAIHNLGHVLAYRGQMEEARRLEQLAVDAFHKNGQTRFEGLARTYLAKIHGMAGDLPDAEREARAAVLVLSSMPGLRAGALAVLARALLALGRADEALDVARETFEVLLSLGVIEEGEAMVRLVYAQALEANGRDREFVEAITAARHHLLARAAKISDPAWRARFLHRVPDNARTLALAAEVSPIERPAG